MNVSLEQSDVVLLREILDSAYRELKSEISHTDNSVFKQQLRDREAQLRNLLDTFSGPLPDAE
jgi:hypothetical protein